MPEQPYSYHDASIPTITIDLSLIAQETASQEQSKRAAYDFSRQLQSALTQAQDAVWNGRADIADAAVAHVQTLLDNSPLMIPSHSNRSPREANLASRVEDHVRLLAFRHFLQTSTLLPPPPLVTDEEYLAGACMGLAQDLQKYGLGRATVRDAVSVQKAAALVADILDYLLQLDFRNGPLRRKYDGTKWCLRTLETLLYELAITTKKNNGDDDHAGDETLSPSPTSNNNNNKTAKRTKTESALLPNDLLKDIRQRMEDRDLLRENLIKLCRDGQKAAKQSIFALHRGDRAKALQLLDKCQTCIQNDLQPMVDQEPFLRQGSFANVLEEYVEAKLFATWLGEEPQTQPAGMVLKFNEFPMTLTPEEYIGGLCDLTGEIGRFAVQRGTVRDVKAVQMSLQTNQAVLSGLQMMEHWPPATGKKMNQVRQSVEKLQRMLYEMSLSEAAGGRNVKTDVEETGPNPDDE